MRRERFWHGAVFVAAGVLAAAGVFCALYSPLAGLVAFALALWPLAIAMITERAGGCVVYPLMIAPVWILLPILGLVAAVMSEDWENAVTPIEAIFFCYFFFAMASMIIALRFRFVKADDRHLVSTGEKITISLIAIAPLALVVGGYIYIAGEWLWNVIRTGQ